MTGLKQRQFLHFAIGQLLQQLCAASCLPDEATSEQNSYCAVEMIEKLRISLFTGPNKDFNFTKILQKTQEIFGDKIFFGLYKIFFGISL